MRNLLSETIEDLMNNGRMLSDIVAVIGDDRRISVEDFIRAADVEYDPYAKHTVVALDLMIIGKDFWMQRTVGRSFGEWWAFYEVPQYEHLPFVKTDVLLSTLSKSKEGRDSFYPSLELLNTEDEDDGEDN